MPILQLSELSLLIWPFVFVVDLVALVLALTTATLRPLIAVLLLTLVAIGAWLSRIPSELTGLPTALFILAGFTIFFFIATGWSARRAKPDAKFTTQLPALSATLPFLLLIMMTLRLPLTNPSPVFGLALLLVILLLGMSAICALDLLPPVALVSMLALEHAWHFQHFDPAHPAAAHLVSRVLCGVHDIPVHCPSKVCGKNSPVGNRGPSWPVAFLLGL
jgi:hypothetical protein